MVELDKESEQSCSTGKYFFKLKFFDEEYLQSFTNERVGSDDSDWGEDFDRNVFVDVID